MQLLKLRVLADYKKYNLKTQNIKIAILGFSFKSNSGDIRFSPMIKFVEYLVIKGLYQIEFYDSTIGEIEIKIENLKRKKTWQGCVENADVVVFGTAHDDLVSINIDDLRSLVKKNAIIFDGRRYFSKKEISSLQKMGLSYLGVGRKFNKIL